MLLGQDGRSGGDANEEQNDRKLDRACFQSASPHHIGDSVLSWHLVMLAVRRRLSWIVGLWLASQIAGVVAAPLAFCCQRAVAIDDEEECCPGLAPGQMCPMHHVRKGDKKEPTCKMRDACGRADAGLVSLAGVVGLLAQPPAVVSPFEVGADIDAIVPSALARAYRPESPPPRI